MSIRRLWACAATIAVCVVSSLATANPLTIATGTSTFPVDDLLSKTTSTEAQCQTIGMSVWVTVDGKGDCIRFYAANLRPSGNPIALVFFHGDVLDGRRLLSGYERESPDNLQKNVAAWSAQSGSLPAIFIARPGVLMDPLEITASDDVHERSS
jgi:hypothetical protein